MAKWADYVITGVWKNGDTITHVCAHLDSATTFGKGAKVAESEVIRKIKSGVTYCTGTWDYLSASWSIGAKVGYITTNGREYLRTANDSTVKDNLDNMIRMESYS